MFVLNPDKYSTLAYRIGPFQTRDVVNNILKNSFKARQAFDQYCEDRFNQYYRNINGREAILIALAQFEPTKENIVIILTRSENFYISGCVTKEIEKVCRWNRSLSPQSDLIFVNHEFGTVYPQWRT